MVGFAGETEEEFAASLAFAKEIAFAKVHVFAYSRRPGTVAYNMPGQVSNAEKEKRSHAMMEATEATRKAFLEKQVGLVQPVLLEQLAAPGIWEGYTPNYTPVHFASEEDLAGKILSLKLAGYEDDFCTGEVLS